MSSSSDLLVIELKALFEKAQCLDAMTNHLMDTDHEQKLFDAVEALKN